MKNDKELRDHILEVFKTSPYRPVLTHAVISFIHERLRFDQELTEKLSRELVHRFFYEKCRYGLSMGSTATDSWVFGITLASGETIALELANDVIHIWMDKMYGCVCVSPALKWEIYGQIRGICVDVLIKWFVPITKDPYTTEIVPAPEKEYTNAGPTVDTFLADVFNNASLNDLADMYFTLVTMGAKPLDLNVVNKRHKKMCKDIEDLNIYNTYSGLLEKLQVIFKSLCTVMSFESEPEVPEMEEKAASPLPVAVNPADVTPTPNPKENKVTRQEGFKAMVNRFRKDVYTKVVLPMDFNGDEFHARFKQRMTDYIKCNLAKSEVSFDLALKIVTETKGFMAVLPFYKEKGAIDFKGNFIGSFRRDEDVLCRFTKNFGYPMRLQVDADGYLSNGIDFMPVDIHNQLMDLVETTEFTRFLLIPIDVLNRDIMAIVEDILVNP